MTDYSRGDIDVSAEPEQRIVDYHVVGRRIVAGIIDLVILIIMFFVMAALFGDVGTTEDDDFEVNLSGGPFFAFVALGYAYYILWEGLAAATAGKMLMGLRVVREDGVSAGWGQVILRNVLRIIDGFLFYIVALLFIAVSKKRQRLGDLAARTLVVRA